MLQRVVQGVHEGGPGQRNVVDERVVEHEAQILLLKIDHEARTEITGEHLRRVVLHRPRRAGTARDDLARALEIDALGFREDKGLGDAEVVDGDGDLVRELAGLARAVIADVDDRLAKSLEERHGALHVGLVPADHDREPGFDRTDLAARYRRVECAEGWPVRGRALREVARRGRTDGAHIDRQQSFVCTARDAVGAEHDGLDVGRVGDHRHHDVAAFGDFAGGANGRRTGIRKRLRAIDRPIRDRDGEACLQRVARHRGAHDPEAHEADALHQLVLLDVIVAREKDGAVAALFGHQERAFFLLVHIHRCDQELVGHVEKALSARELVRDGLGERVLLERVNEQRARLLHKREEFEGFETALVREKHRVAELLIAFMDLVEEHLRRSSVPH